MFMSLNTENVFVVQKLKTRFTNVHTPCQLKCLNDKQDAMA